MSEESSSIKGLPNEAGTNKLSEVGIEEINLNSPIELYHRLREIPENKRNGYTMMFACTGGNERSRIMGNVANQMGFDVASILNPNPSYHRKYGVPVGELIDPAYGATFPEGKIQFSDFLDKPVNYIVIFTNEILGPRGDVEVKDNYTTRMINAISLGLSKSSKESGHKPQKVTLIRVPATERQAQQVERLFKADN